jgi:hypothetical protein
VVSGSQSFDDMTTALISLVFLKRFPIGLSLDDSMTSLKCEFYGYSLCEPRGLVYVGVGEFSRMLENLCFPQFCARWVPVLPPLVRDNAENRWLLDF